MGNNNSIKNKEGYWRILVVGPKNGDDCLTELSKLPTEARILATGETLEELKADGEQFLDCNIVLNVSGNSEKLAPIVSALYQLEWIHSITAGIDHLICPEIHKLNNVTITNAKGIYSSSLAEYVMTACSYFSKDIPRLIQNKIDKKWDRFCVGELKGKTMGIIGYGDIGCAVARLANAYGMKVLALRKRPELSLDDHWIDRVYGIDGLSTIMSEADFLVVALALTKETRHFIKEKHFKVAKEGQIFINIARGAVVDEKALIKSLQTGKLGGAALDVFTVEPLPENSPIWNLDNVLLSPHNADMTNNFRHKSVEFFTENVKRFVNGENLLCQVDIVAGY